FCTRSCGLGALRFTEQLVSILGLGERLAAEKADARKLQEGLWYIMPVYKGDHMSLQGGLTIENEIASFYIEHLNIINSLEE
ncbi:MAG: hypothetical protein IKQ84_06990, partial [Spirochaetaceae bacterium]|nr:hypothetical protein [Spirochaetaceae bacterium]